MQFTTVWRAQEDESFRKQHLLSAAWELTIFWRGLVEPRGLGHKFAFLQAPREPLLCPRVAAVPPCPCCATLCWLLPRLCLGFGDAHTLLKPGFQSEQLKFSFKRVLPWRLSSRGKMIYCRGAAVCLQCEPLRHVDTNL